MVVTSYERNSISNQWPIDSPHISLVKRKACPCHDVTMSTVEPLYGTIFILQNTNKGHSIFRPWGWNLVFLRVHRLIFSLCLSLWCYMWYIIYHSVLWLGCVCYKTCDYSTLVFPKNCVCLGVVVFSILAPVIHIIQGLFHRPWANHIDCSFMENINVS